MQSSKVPLFAIMREIRGDKSEKLTPMVKQPGFMQSWTAISKVNDKYFPVEVAGDDHVFTEDECNAYIKGYKDQLERQNANKIVNVVYQEVA